MKTKTVGLVTAMALLIISNNALAAYTQASSAPVYVQSIYSNDPSLSGWGACYIHGIQIVD